MLGFGGDPATSAKTASVSDAARALKSAPASADGAGRERGAGSDRAADRAALAALRKGQAEPRSDKTARRSAARVEPDGDFASEAAAALSDPAMERNLDRAPTQTTAAVAHTDTEAGASAEGATSGRDQRASSPQVPSQPHRTRRSGDEALVAVPAAGDASAHPVTRHAEPRGEPQHAHALADATGAQTIPAPDSPMEKRPAAADSVPAPDDDLDLPDVPASKVDAAALGAVGVASSLARELPAGRPAPNGFVLVAVLCSLLAIGSSAVRMLVRRRAEAQAKAGARGESR
jgi:hypothetical protein